jgi:hypothetical protein
MWIMVVDTSSPYTFTVLCARASMVFFGRVLTIASAPAAGAAL